jgi:hypothetical protein
VPGAVCIPFVFGEFDAALVGIAGLAEIGRQRLEILEGDVGGDVNRIRTQKIAQETNLHRLALEIVDNMLAHVARADAVIDRVVEPGAALQQIGKGRLPDP